MGARLRAIDLFCGAGGSSWGAHKANIDVVAAFDMWDLAGQNHSVNFPGARFVHGRLEDHNVSTLRRQIGTIDLVLASPECTNHSPAKGNKPRDEASKDTAFQVVRFAEAFRPRWVVVENVVNMRRWSRYEEFKGALRQLGYHLREQVLNSADFGVAQTRRRLFLLCDLQVEPPEVSGRSRKRAPIKQFLFLDDRYDWTPLRHPRRAAATLARAEKGIAAIGPNQPFILVYYGSDHAGGWQKLSRPLRTITTLDRFALVKPSPAGHLMRMLQVDELKAAMGMAGMKFAHGTRRDRIKMIGNGVCPPVMHRVITTITQVDRSA